MKRHRRALACVVPELLVGTTLPNLHKSQPAQDCDNLCRLEYRDIPHCSGDHDRLDAHELRVEFGLSVFKQHLEYFPKVAIQFIETGALRVCPREPGYIPNEETGLRVTLDHS